MEFWDDLIDFIKEGRVIPVIGPSLLKIKIDGGEVFLYQHIARMLAAELGFRDSDFESPEFTINDVACKYLRMGKSPQKIYSRIRSIVEKVPPGSSESLRKLARIPSFKLFVSTTFDSLMEQAINAERFAGESRTISRFYMPNQVRNETADLPLDYGEDSPPVVFRLFGRVSAMPEYVVTEEDTLEFITALQSKERQPNRLFDELKCNHLLILGNYFPDWLARFFIRMARGERFSSGSSFMRQYLAEEKLRQDASLISFLESFSRDQTEVYTESSPCEFVDELLERWQQRHPLLPEPAIQETISASGSKTPMEGPFVFLSYTRNDSEATARIASSLEKAGIKVWQDRSHIHFGDEWIEEIRKNIQKCSLFFAIISRNTHNRDEGVFYEEWQCALERARRMNPEAIFIIPLPIDESPVPAHLGKKHYEIFPDGHLTPDFISYVQQVLQSSKRQTKPLAHAL